MKRILPLVLVLAAASTTFAAAKPKITSATTATGQVGVAFSYQITADQAITTYGATGLPAGLTVNTSTGLISGTPAAGTDAGSPYSVSLSVTNANGTGTATLTLTIKPPPPVITSSTTPTGQACVPFSYTITATNNPTSYGASGLPAFLTISGNTISGTPNAPGTYTFTVSATNAGGTGSATVTLTVANAPTPTIASPLTATGQVGAGFTYTIVASPCVTSYNATGLPGGLSVNTTTGVISGTPAAGTDAGSPYSVTISATNSGGTGTATLTLTIKPATPVITSSLTATGQVGVAFSYQITATNNPTSYNATGLPAGLSVNTSTGLISGTPTTAGTYSVTISATNAGGTGSATLTLTIKPQPPAITSATSASGTVGVAFSYQITATNNPTSYNATGLPAGLTVNTSTGLISGTPTTAGTYSVTISATNSGGTGTATLSLTILSGAPITTSPTTASGTVCNAFSYQITATNNPTSYGATGLPAGLTVNTSTGVISGTPTAPGTFTVTISATNSKGTGSASLTITISPPPPPVITSAATATGTVGVAFTYQIVASNCPTSYNATGLPTGLSVDTSTGAISGTPAVGTDAGSPYSVTISATNSGGTGSATLTLTIKPAKPVITSSLTASGQVGVAFSYQITATNNPTSFNAIGLPAGLSVNTSTGLISGTPTTTGTYSVTISATNAGGTGSATLVITICAATPTITSISPACAMAGGNGFTLTVNGTNFVSGSTVNWNGTSLATTFKNSTQLTATVPKANIANPGTASITVLNPGTCGATSNALTFTISGMPTISSLNPNCATVGGTDLTLIVNGTNFVSTSLVNWNATALVTTFVSSTQLTATVPASLITTAGTASVTVVNPNPCGATSSAVTFTIANTPVITSPLTASGQLGVAFSYTITATNTDNKSTYTAAPLPPGLSLSKNVISGTPTTGGTTNVTITVSNGAGACNAATATLVLTIDAPPVITSPLTATGTAGSPFSYQITATNSPTSYDAIDLPGGLTLGPTPGQISGTPTGVGVFPVTISATNASGTGSATLTLTINFLSGVSVPPFTGQPNVFDTGSTTDPSKDPSFTITFPNPTTDNYFELYWNLTITDKKNQGQDRDQSIIDLARGGLQRDPNLSPGMKYNGYDPTGQTTGLPKTPDPLKYVWRGNPSPPYYNPTDPTTGAPGSFGDPRASWYLTTPWPSADYVTGSYWGGPNPQIKPLTWPDSGHNFSTPGLTPQQAANLPPTGTPTPAPGWLPPAVAAVANPSPTPDPNHAISLLSTVARDALTSVAELGNVFDPAQLSYSVTNPGGALPDIPSSANLSSTGGGGHTLAIGRPEFSRFDTNGMRAWQLLDVFGLATGTTNTAGLVNINTASRDVLRSLAAGILLNRDSAMILTTNSPLYSPMDTKVADRFADAVINSRPLLSTSALSAIRDSQGQPFFGNSNQYNSNPTQTAPTEWNDPAREELFAKIFNLATTRSRNFRVFVTGQSLDKNGNVLSTVTKVYQVFVKPNRDPSTGAIQSQQVEIKYEGSM